MKLFIASDLHGSAFYCDKMLENFEKETADNIILLGDILYHGPRNDLPFEYAPKKVCASLNAYADRILCVRGNCESEVDGMVLSFPVMAEYAVVFIDGRRIYLTHGHKINRENPLPFSQGDIVLLGHTHIPSCETENGVTFINPGSLSIPKENSPHSYMTYENSVFRWKKLENSEQYREICL